MMHAAAPRAPFWIKLQAQLDARIVRPLPLFFAIFSVFLLVFAASIFLVPKRYGRLIVGDGIYYYVYLRSVVFDRDLEFTNDYVLYQQYNDQDPVKKAEMLGRKTPNGMAGNFFSVGPAVLWSPVYLATHLVAALLGQTGDGFSFAYEAPILFASIAYGFAGIWLMYRVASEMFSKFAAFVSVLGIWLGTNVVYYMGVSPSASHVLSMFTSALFLYLWWRGRTGRTRRDWFVWGLSAGLMALVRWQDVLIAFLALFEWVNEGFRIPRDGLARTSSGAASGGQSAFLLNHSFPLRNGVVFIFGTIVAFVPQMVAWQILYGSPLTAPQGGGFFQILHPEILNVWFSTKRGLFSWTPLLVFAVIGFVPLYQKNKTLGAAAILIFLCETYVNSIVNDWWGGEAFGARRFISLMPFFALGLAALLDAVRTRVSQNVVLLVLTSFLIWNNLFLLQYNLWLHGIGHISAMPTVQEMTVDKFTAPFRVLDALRRK